jgi:hypothetical protein
MRDGLAVSEYLVILDCSDILELRAEKGAPLSSS